MIASFAKANQVDITQQNRGALKRLAGYVLTHNTHDEWLEPYCDLTKCDSVTLARRDGQRPIKNRRLGGQLTLIYAQ